MDNIRTRAWRRSKARANANKSISTNEKKWMSEKNWKLIYTRSEKLGRARQLGIEYPKRTIRQVLDEELPPVD